MRKILSSLYSSYNCSDMGGKSLINNVETIAMVPDILHRGGEWFPSLLANQITLVLKFFLYFRARK